MAPHDATDPALTNTPIPLDGDGAELIGMVVDNRYRLEATLGRGGMGLVFRATHIGLRRQVAVKILHPSLAASPEVRNRFEREALAVGKVDHPNCVATYDVGRLPGGAMYLAMEVLEGRSLADVLEDEGQIAPGRALHILAHILRGLGNIHQAGLIHRDIKPENIFLIRQGEDLDFAKILDFGIAKPISGELSDDGVRLTQAGMAFGTPIYMAPEQALGNPLDGRADIYAASVLAYEMLCGQPPFYSEDKLEVMSMHTAKPVPPMRTRLIKGGKPVPSSLEKLIVRGLTKKPSDRYASAEVYLAAVEEALHTADGGQTDVNFERVITSGDEMTGARSLIDDDLRIKNDPDFETEDNSAQIGDAIDEVLAVTPNTSTAAVRAKTPVRGTRDVTKIGVGPDAPIVAPGDPRGRLGGMGIGLPYTGPSGEPIFGLTPEQRLASVPVKKKRWPIYAAIAGVALIAIGAGVAVALFTARPADQHKIDPNSPAGQAMDQLEHGEAAKAIQLLEAKGSALDHDADAQLVLGHAYAARNEASEALIAYRKALQLDPSLAVDKTVLANVRQMATDADPDVVTNAFDVWVGFTRDPEAKKALKNAAIAQDLNRRRAARPVVERYKLGDAIEWLDVYSLDLQQEATCENRKEAVAHLRALNDPRAIEPLERALARKGTSPAMRNKAFSPCLTEDAKAAIAVLKKLKAKP
ncbi:MAG: serine/threonine protein kinase with repeat [Myxococcales bacterium]|nr:serine/threonine protein kinase with repeat [Myxococcales bacterium]